MKNDPPNFPVIVNSTRNKIKKDNKNLHKQISYQFSWKFLEKRNISLR